MPIHPFKLQIQVCHADNDDIELVLKLMLTAVAGFAEGGIAIEAGINWGSDWPHHIVESDPTAQKEMGSFFFYCFWIKRMGDHHCSCQNSLWRPRHYNKVNWSRCVVNSTHYWPTAAPAKKTSKHRWKYRRVTRSNSSSSSSSSSSWLIPIAIWIFGWELAKRKLSNRWKEKLKASSPPGLMGVSTVMDLGRWHTARMTLVISSILQDYYTGTLSFVFFSFFISFCFLLNSSAHLSVSRIQPTNLCCLHLVEPRVIESNCSIFDCNDVKVRVQLPENV